LALELGYIIFIIHIIINNSPFVSMRFQAS